MKTLRTLLFLTVALLVAVPALAETLTLKATGAETGPDQGSAVNIGLRRYLTVSVNVTTGSGSRRRMRTISSREGMVPQGGIGASNLWRGGRRPAGRENARVRRFQIFFSGGGIPISRGFQRN